MERELRRLRSGSRRRLVLHAGCDILAVVAAAVSAGALLDYLLRTPTALRMAAWVIGVAAAYVAARRMVGPALRFDPPLREFALRMERGESGRAGGLSGVLASGLEFSGGSGVEGAEGARLRARVVEEASRRFASAGRVERLIRRARTREALVVLACALAPAVMAGWLSPRLASIGLTRIAAPWAGAEWPKRWTVRDATGLSAQAVGGALPLRALVLTHELTGGLTGGRSPVFAHYRLVRDGRTVAERREPMISQGFGRTEAPGELFERLVEPRALAEVGQSSDGDELEYWFETPDDRTRAGRVRLVTPPGVLAARAEISPPGYAASLVGAGVFGGARDLGPGRDERATVGPVLAGSRVVLTLDLTKEIPGPPEDEAGRSAWMSAVFGEGVLPEGVAGVFEGATWTLGFELARSVRVAPVLTDRYGIRSAEEPAFRFEAVEDQPPTVAIVEPPHDDFVLASAVVSLAADARDDVGLASLEMERVVRSRPAGSESGEASEEGGAEVVASLPSVSPASPPGAPGREARLEAVLDLGPMGLTPGQEVWVTATARDVLGALGSAERGAGVRSKPRRLRVISEAEFIEQIRGELSGIRQTAARLDREQGEVSRGEVGDAPGEAPRRQGSIAERIAGARQGLERLGERAARNGLSDPAMEQVLRDAREAASRAEQSARSAAGDLAQADREARAEDPAERAREAETRDRAGEGQRRTRDELGRLIDMLSRGQDAYAAERLLDRLVQEQRQLTERTEEAARASAGRRAEDLSAEEREGLARLAAQQRDAARRTQQAIDELADRARRSERTDPGLSEAMDRAAQEGRRTQAAQQQQQAAGQIEQNRTQSANEMQRRAEEALERMRDELRRADQRRDEVLRRLLADLARSIEGLIARQEGELAALARLAEGVTAAALGAGMIELHRATLGVADDVPRDRAMAGVDQALRSAAGAQGGAIAALRAAPADAGAADAGERTSLQRLREALEQVREQARRADARDESRRREELRQAYLSALSEQQSIADQARSMVGRDLSRRERALARELGAAQEKVRQTLDDLREKYSDVGDATMFDYAHDRLHGATASAARVLNAGEVTRGVRADHDTALRLLGALADALREEGERSSDFREQEGGRQDNQGGDGQGGQGNPNQGGAIPPVAQLKLLRLMQAEAAERTRAIAEQGADPGAGGVGEVGDLQRELERRGKALIEMLKQSRERRPEGEGPPAPPGPGPVAGSGASQEARP